MNARQIVRRMTLSLFVVVLAGLLGTIRYDRDLIKRAPVVGRLPWRVVFGNTATQPIPKATSAQYQRDLEAAKLARPRVIFLGDSITNRWHSDGQDVWRRVFAPLNAVFLGDGDGRTQHLLYRLRSGEFRGLTPHCVHILIGTNNLGRNTPAEISEAIEMIVAEVRQEWPSARIVLMGIFPRECSGLDQEDISQVNRQLADRYRDQPSIRLLDIGDRFLNAKGVYDPELMPDGLHLSQAGYEVWAREVRPILEEWSNQQETLAATDGSSR
jgi:lysophospholipase L1-like esterase